MGSRRVRLTMTATAVAALLAAPGAGAGPSAADRETARSMMQEGRDLRDKGDLKGALQRFKSADDIMHVPTTALEVARTQVSLGLLVEALDTIAAIRKSPPQPDDPAPFKDARTKAEELDAQVEAKVPSLNITVSGGAEGETPGHLDRRRLGPAAAAGVPRKVDPGHHVVTARARSGEAKEEVDVTEGEKKDVQLVLVAGRRTRPPKARRRRPTAEPEAPHNVHSPGALTWGGRRRRRRRASSSAVVTGDHDAVEGVDREDRVPDDNKCTSPQRHLGPQLGQHARRPSRRLVRGGRRRRSGRHRRRSSSATRAPAPPRRARRRPTPTRTPALRNRRAARDGVAPARSPWIGLGSAGVFGTF